MTLFHACIVLAVLLGLAVAKIVVAWLVKEDAVIMARRDAATELVKMMAPLVKVSSAPFLNDLIDTAAKYSNGNYKEFAKHIAHFFYNATKKDSTAVADVVKAARAIVAYEDTKAKAEAALAAASPQTKLGF